MARNAFSSVIPNRAGGDISSDKIYLAVRDEQVVNFPTHTAGLKESISYLKSHGVESVAVEATGVYWLNFFDLAESAGLDVWLVNPKYTKSRAGRKTDVLESRWIEQLHSADLLERSFVPDLILRQLRDYMRIRENYIEHRSQQSNRMSKALIQMNVRIDQVLSQVHGVSGLRMIEAILKGQRDPKVLIALCDGRIVKHKSEELHKALEGNYQKQYLFALQMAFDDFHYFDQKIAKCDQQIEAQLEQLTSALPEPEQVNKPKLIRHNKPKIKELQRFMQTLFDGQDLTQLPGITNYSLLRLVSELGVKMDPWPTKKHFTSWLGLAPKQHQSGKYRRQPFIRASPRGGLIFRQLALSLIQSKNIALGAFGRRIRAKKGPKVAIKALARKLAELYYLAVTRGIEYVEQGVTAYQQHYQEQQLRLLQKNAKKFGYELVISP